MLFGQIIHHGFVFFRKIVTALETHPDDLPSVAGMAPGVMPQTGMEPEMEIIWTQRAIDDVVKFLPDEKPGDRLRVVRVNRAYYQGTRPIGSDHLARAVFDRLAVLSRMDDHMIAVVLEPGKRGTVVDFRAASFYRPVIGVFAVQMRRGAAEKIQRHRHHAGEMEGHAAAGGRLVQHFARQRTEVLQQETVPARRQDAAADFVARQFLPLQDNGLQAGVDQALGGRGRGQTGADNDYVNGTHHVVKSLALLGDLKGAVPPFPNRKRFS